jgi:parallel beta-helix repeat protein
MKSVLPALLAAAACLCLSSSIRANTFYVATSGSDSNPGASAKPWLTLQHGVDTISPGDTILVESGTYAGCRIGNSGTASAVCTLMADTGASVLINAAGPDNKHNSNIEVELFGGTVSYWVISGFESANSLNYGIDLRGTAFITVENCFTTESTLTGIFLAFCDNTLIQNNETSFNNEHGIYDSNSAANTTISANRSHDNKNSGIHMNGDDSEQPGDGLITNALVEKNIIYNNGTGGGSGINCDGVTGSTIRNNLLYNNLASGISLYAIDGAQGSSNDLIYNNTIVMASGSRWPINIAASTGGQPNPTGNQVMNNILYTPDAGHGSITTYAPAVAGFASDYNVVVAKFSDDGDNTTITLSAWQALGYDLHSIVATPANLFVDPANNNYQLKAGSPAIAAGISLPQVTDDIDGTPRPAHPSIGCYEVAAAEPPNYVGFVDSANCTSITGWAADRNRLNTSINVEVYDGATLLTTVLASNSRPDVGAFLGDNGLHGFSIPTPAALLNGSAHTVHVKFETSATDLTGSPFTLTCGASLPPNYIGFLDSATCTTVSGWAADKNHLNTSINVELYNGTTLIAILPATLSRPDVGAYLGDNGLHGFSITTPDQLKTGAAHSLHVKFATTATDLSGSPASVTCTPATPNYVGFVDVANCSQIAGWAADRNRLNSSITVDIYDGGTLILTLNANLSRPDVGAFLGDNGKHGFSIAVPAALETGTAHSVHIKFETSATDLTGSPASLSCASGSSASETADVVSPSGAPPRKSLSFPFRP